MSDNKKAADAAASASLQEEMDAVMRKYDRESATRIWAGKPKIVISVVMALFSVYCIWSTLFSTAALEIRLTAFLGLIVIMGYLTYPASKKHVHANRLPWYDIVIMVIGAAAFFYYCFNYSVLIKTLTSAAKMTPFLIAVGVAGILVLAELCRRCVGLPILVVVREYAQRRADVPAGAQPRDLHALFRHVRRAEHARAGVREVHRRVHHLRRLP